MKTTFDIADHIMERSRLLAKKEGVALKELVEEGLLMVIRKHETLPREPIRPVTFKGHGLGPEFQGQGWSAIRDALYQGRGT